MSSNLTIPAGVLERYPLCLPTVVTALWEVYMAEPRADPMVLKVNVKRLLARLGKPCDDTQRRALYEILYEIYKVQKVGFRMGPDDDNELAVTLWLTPEILKRVKIYHQQMMEAA